ncbi:MAG: hypothetical protein PPP58_01300 [Natronomonas sp.]
MSVLPGGIDTSQQPPMTIPLRHFVVSLAFFLAGIALEIGLFFDALPGLGRIAHVHLLLVGWICVTIMGAMTQFVPVWSATTLHSRRLANAQLALVAFGLLGVTLSYLRAEFLWIAAFGLLLLVGFWTFVYNIARTLATVEHLDVTERHFLVALGFFVVVSVLGVLLAVNFVHPLFPRGVTAAGVLGAHATLAVFGAVLTTIYGALYQLATMFTQTDLDGLDRRLGAIEEIGHPIGVVTLAIGRLLESAPIARLGGLLVLVAALSFGFVFARKLVTMQVERTPMHTRYAVVAVSLLSWVVVSAPAWLRSPIDPAHRFGAAGSGHLLLFGAIGFVVLGTLYHIVPFIIWVHRYSDKLGLEDVPMVDDLYDDRLAAVDGTLLVGGMALLVGGGFFESPSVVTALGGASIAVGAAVFTLNVLLVIHRHGPQSFDRLLFGSLVLPAVTI